MPTLKEIVDGQKTDLADARAELAQLYKKADIDKVWDVGDEVSLVGPGLPVVNKYDANKMWHAISVSFVAYDFAKEHERGPDWDEEPLFLCSAIVDGKLKPVRFPTGAAEEVDELETERGGEVLTYSNLATAHPHAIASYAIAFDAGSSEMKEIVEAVGLDINHYVTAGIQLLPAGQNTATALTNVLKKKVKGLFDDTKVSNESFIVDEHTIWGRNVDKLTWSGIKWKLFNLPHKKLWYLGLWRIDLFGYPLDLQWDGKQAPSGG
jgi:hypothetical protein